MSHESSEPDYIYYLERNDAAPRWAEICQHGDLYYFRPGAQGRAALGDGLEGYHGGQFDTWAGAMRLARIWIDTGELA